MGSLRTSHRFSAPALGALLLGTVLTGCVETEPEAAPEPESTPSASSSPSADPSPEDDTPSELQIPEQTDAEIARTVFGGGENPVTPVTITDVVKSGEPLILEGACVGETATYTILSAVEGDSGEKLESGTLDCRMALYEEFSLDVDGPVQLAFTDTDDIDEGWLVLTRGGTGG